MTSTCVWTCFEWNNWKWTLQKLIFWLNNLTLNPSKSKTDLNRLKQLFWNLFSPPRILIYRCWKSKISPSSPRTEQRVWTALSRLHSQQSHYWPQLFIDVVCEVKTEPSQTAQMTQSHAAQGGRLGNQLPRNAPETETETIQIGRRFVRFVPSAWKGAHVPHIKMTFMPKCV